MNRLFLVAITGECCLMYLHGIRPRHYNPFALLRTQLLKEGIVLKNNRLVCLEYLKQLYVDNGMELHKLLQTALDKKK